MIDKDALVSIAKIYGRKPWQQEKHYVQSLIVAALSEYPLVFKGGTYLWFFHGLNRFSEDVDFTATGKIPEDIDAKVSEALRIFGVENKVKRMTDDERGFSFRISARGPLNTSDVDLCHVYVEISRRENLLLQPLPFQLNFDGYRMPTKIINGMDPVEIIAEKIRAIMTRKKPRDLYDLVFLIKTKKMKFDLKLINEKLKYYNETFLEQKFYAQLQKHKENWKKELGQLVFDELMDYENALEIVTKWTKTGMK